MVQNRLQEVVALAQSGLDDLDVALPDANGLGQNLALNWRRLVARLTEHTGMRRYSKAGLPSPLPQMHDAQFRQAAKLAGYLAHAQFHMGVDAPPVYSDAIVAAAPHKG